MIFLIWYRFETTSFSFLLISDENVPGGVRYATWGLGNETLDFNTAAEKALSIYYVNKRTGWAGSKNVSFC